MKIVGEAGSIARPAHISLDGIMLHADLAIPSGAKGIVLFAHGSGSSRFSPRNRAVASRLHDGRISTLLLDLLTIDEEKAEAATGQFRFDIGLLSSRLVAVTGWVRQQPELEALPVGYFGASTGAAAAIAAAAVLPNIVRAVVSRGGRPDLAGPALEAIVAPTLLIVGGLDTAVINLNRDAFHRLHCVKRLDIVSRAGHLFEEPGTLEQVSRLAKEWFERYLMFASPDSDHFHSDW